MFSSCVFTHRRLFLSAFAFYQKQKAKMNKKNPEGEKFYEKIREWVFHNYGKRHTEAGIRTETSRMSVFREISISKCFPQKKWIKAQNS